MDAGRLHKPEATQSSSAEVPLDKGDLGRQRLPAKAVRQGCRRSSADFGSARTIFHQIMGNCSHALKNLDPGVGARFRRMNPTLWQVQSVSCRCVCEVKPAPFQLLAAARHRQLAVSVLATSALQSLTICFVQSSFFSFVFNFFQVFVVTLRHHFSINQSCSNCHCGGSLADNFLPDNVASSSAIGRLPSCVTASWNARMSPLAFCSHWPASCCSCIAPSM